MKCALAALLLQSAGARTLGMHAVGLLQVDRSRSPARADTMTAEGLTSWLAAVADPQQQPLPSSEYLQRNSEYALRARQEVPAVATVPESLFRDFVVPYRQLDEPIDEWRPSFFEVLAPFVKDAKSVREVVELVVPRVWSELRASEAVMGDAKNATPVSFKSNCTPAIMAPISETLKEGHASCSGCSILAANGLRAVGVPARVAGTPEWNTKDGGNHNWVEVWTGEAWSFFDAAPAEEVKLNEGWFVPSNTKDAISGPTHGIFAAAWDSSTADTKYPYTWREPATSWPALDRTPYYKHLGTSS